MTFACEMDGQITSPQKKYQVTMSIIMRDGIDFMNDMELGCLFIALETERIAVRPNDFS